MRVSPRLASILLSVVASALAVVDAADAATFVVTREDDPPPGSCNVGDCSLREAVMAANAAPGSTITVPAGTYTLTIPGSDDATFNPAIGDLDILVGTTIAGAGVGVTFVQSGPTPQSGIHRIFDNASPGATVISRMTIRNGVVEPDVDISSGGCIRNLGVLTLDSVVVSGCLTRIGGGGISSFHTLTIINSAIAANAVDNLTGVAVSGGGVAGGPGGIVNPSTVNIVNSVISNNVVASAGNVDLTALGGGFVNTATMTITGSVISGNTALNAGGGINGASAAVMTIQRSTVADNKARYDVGGVDNDGTMTISDSTFNGNVAGFGCVGAECNRSFAGGVLNTAGGTMFVNNSTISGNTCLVSGGGISTASGTLTISSTTITENTCGLGAGLTATAVANVKNTIIGANTATSPSGGDVSATAAHFNSQGYNLIQDLTGSSIGGNTTGNITGVSPSLGTLQNNGGPTFTHALNPDSPAINAGNPAGCLDHAGAPLLTDQRGYVRQALGRCDMGAFEAAADRIFADGFDPAI